jgi:type II secretory pathway predicted ATPase ExeA
MYKEFFHLRANPFNVNPDPRYLFLTRHTEEALACLTYGIQSRKGFVLLTGEVGTGKTTLINKLLEWLRVQQVPTAFVFNSRLNVPQFLDYMMADFGIPCDSRSKSQILLRLYNWLLDRYRAGETAVLIVDEAQGLSDELLEEIRMMTNLETFTEKLLQIVLVGQPELEQKLKQTSLRQLRQRLTLRAKTHPLTAEETRSYVAQRLRIAGWDGQQQIFDADSLSAIHRYSSGIPRVVNLICEHCLVSAFVDQQKVVTAPVVDVVARDFDLIDSPVSGMALPPAQTTAAQDSGFSNVDPRRRRLSPINMERRAAPLDKPVTSDDESPALPTLPSISLRDESPAPESPSLVDHQAPPPDNLITPEPPALPTLPSISLRDESPAPEPSSSIERQAAPENLIAVPEPPAPPRSMERRASAPAPQSATEHFDLVDALKTLANLADRLREPEQDAPKERKI